MGTAPKVRGKRTGVGTGPKVRGRRTLPGAHSTWCPEASVAPGSCSFVTGPHRALLGHPVPRAAQRSPSEPSRQTPPGAVLQCSRDRKASAKVPRQGLQAAGGKKKPGR